MGVPYAEVIGDPIGHSKSPLIHKFWLEKLGLEGDYRTLTVRPGEVRSYLERRRRDPDWRGCNATMPLKGELFDVLISDTERERARLAAFNCCFAIGDAFIREKLPLNVAVLGASTDHLGLGDPFLNRVLDRDLLVVVGTGATARTALFGFSGYRNYAVVARDRRKAQAMLDALGITGRILGLDEPLPPASLLVNATPLGMRGFPEWRPDLSALPANAIVYDLVYDPMQTGLVKAARARGLETLDGLVMLIGQARTSFQLFFKALAPRDHDPELRRRLEG